MEHRFSGPSFTLGIEEELMIVDEETLDLSNSIESLLSDLSDIPTEGEVKPELMESVCEIATTPVRNTVEAGVQLRALRRTVNQVAQQHGLAIGSAGTHPFALWEDQRIVARPRYRDLISGLQFVARQEIIFGIHVHVGVDHPDKAIH
jgi:carboxylate-amine ligase